MDTQTGRKKRQAESKGNEMGMGMGRVSVKSQAIMQWKCYNAFSAASVGQQTEKKNTKLQKKRDTTTTTINESLPSHDNTKRPVDITLRAREMPMGILLCSVVAAGGAELHSLCKTGGTNRITQKVNLQLVSQRSCTDPPPLPPAPPGSFNHRTSRCSRKGIKIERAALP